MKKYICLFIYAIISVSSYAVPILPEGVVRDAFADVVGGSSEARVSVGSGSETRIGSFSVAANTTDWASRARSAKDFIRSRLVSNGWTVDLDLNQEPTGKVPFEITMRGVKQHDVFLVHVVVFLPREGLADVAYSEQASRE